MKRIISALLIIITLFCTGIMSSCSCTAKPAVAADKIGTNHSASDVLNNTRTYLMKKYTNGDQKILDKKLVYYIVPASDNKSFFMRYKLSTVSNRDLLLLEDGTIYIIDEDNYDGLRGYNEFYSFDITSAYDSEVLSQKGLVKGG